MQTLTPRTLQVIKEFFPKDQWESISQFLSTELTPLKVWCSDWSPQQMERIWFAALKMITEGLNSQAVMRLAQTDYRDLLIAADFADDLHAHLQWAKGMFSKR